MEEKKIVYHPYLKNNPYVRKALYEAYSKKCVYCGDLIKPKNMHVDHILATNAEKMDDYTFNQYVKELNEAGFIIDSIENYYPSCAACNLKKNNKNFTVLNFRAFHNEALSKATTVLSLIKKYEKQGISFDAFDPDYEYWEKIDFSKQKDISDAIAGYRLQPCHVTACPRIAQVDEIKAKLNIVDYVVIEGEPGCGKSITVYQAAYDFCIKGWQVYRYINKSSTDDVFLPQSDDKKYLIIVDDAQNLPGYFIERFIKQALNNVKVIFSFTTNIKGNNSLYVEPIIITNSDAVKAISLDYRKRKDEILPIVQKFDNHVGDGLTDTPFESRLKNAATKNTPWLLNYTLRGGWNTINAQIQSVYSHNKCGLLCAIVALLQILKKDSAIDYIWLQDYVQAIDKTLVWTEKDLEFLIQKRIVASKDDVRIIHIESAKYVISSFFRIADESSKKILREILEKAYEENFFSEQGLCWLQNVLFVSTYGAEYYLLSEQLLDSVFSNIQAVVDDERRGYIIYLLERVFKYNRIKNGKAYFRQNEQTIAQWISETTGKNAYAFAQLINTLNNERDDSLKLFSEKVNVETIISNFDSSSIDELFQWGYFLERFACSYKGDRITEFGRQLENSFTKKSLEVTEKNVGDFYYAMSNLYYVNPELTVKLLSDNITNYKKLCLSNIEEAMEIFDIRFLDNVCGLHWFSNCKPTSQQRSFSKQFIKALPILAFANYISHSVSRNWQTIYEIGRLLYRDNKKIYAKLVKALDYNALNKYTSSLWKKTSGDLHLLFSFICFGDMESAKKFFEANQNKIEELGLPFIKILPAETIGLHKNGTKIRLFENHWNHESYFALKALYETSAEGYKEILDIEKTQLALKISECCILDFDKEEKPLNEILLYIKGTYPSVLFGILDLLDYEKMKKEKVSMLNDYRYSQSVKKKYNNLINLLFEFSDEKNAKELQSIKAIKAEKESTKK